MDTTESVTALAIVRETWEPGQLEIIKEMIAPGASHGELALFAQVCRRTGLDPFAKQIYAVMRSAGKDDHGNPVKKMTIQTGIDGYRLMAARTGELAGIDDAEYDTEDADNPGWARVTVWRLVQGVRVPFTAKARWKEYAQYTDEWMNGKKTGNQKPSNLWAKMPYLMLGKCAEALALRKAFPAEISGVYTAEEMSQADSDPAPYVMAARDESADADSEYTRMKAQIKARRRGQKLTWSGLRLRATTLNYSTQDQWEGVCVEGTGGKEDPKTYTAADLEKVADFLDGQEAKAKLFPRAEIAVDATPTTQPHDLRDLGTVAP